MPSSSISGATSILLTDQYPLNTSSMGSNKCKRTRSPHYRETFNLNPKTWNVLIHNQGQNWMLHMIMQSDLKRVNSFTWSHSLLFPNPKARGSTWVQIGPNETLPPGTLCVCVCELYWTSIRPILSMHVNEWVKFQAQGFVGDTRVRSGQDYVNNSTPTTRSLFRLPTACLRQISRSDRHNKQTGWEVQKHIQTWINTHAQTHINSLIRKYLLRDKKNGMNCLTLTFYANPQNINTFPHTHAAIPHLNC